MSFYLNMSTEREKERERKSQIESESDVIAENIKFNGFWKIIIKTNVKKKLDTKH